MHPTPVKRPNLTRKLPLTDMPIGLLAALVCRARAQLDRYRDHRDEWPEDFPYPHADSEWVAVGYPRVGLFSEGERHSGADEPMTSVTGRTD
jgi:hypothetical protein